MVIPEIKLQVHGYECQGVAENCDAVPIIYRQYAEGASSFTMPYAYFISSSFGRYVNKKRPFLDNLDDVELNLKVQEDIRTGRAILVVDDSTEMFGDETRPTLERLYQRYQFLNPDNFVYSTSDKNASKLEFCDVYGDHFILEYCKRVMIDKDIPEYKQILDNRSNTFKYKFCCLQGEPREHRIPVYRRLRSMYNSSQAICTINSGLRFKPDEPIQAELGPYDSNQDNHFVWHMIEPQYFINCASAFVTETFVDDNKCSISEKIIKQLIYPQPFVAYAPPGVIQDLRNLGYRVYDEYVDHSYDTITDRDTRLNSALSSFTKLIDNQHFPKERVIAEHNRNITRNLNISKNFIAYLHSKLNR